MLTVTDIALNKLVPSPRNVRRTGCARIEELAASIAAHGLLQNLTVVETTAKGKKAYEVIAGGRRLAALRLLANRKEMAGNAPVPCHVVTDANVTELSLAENALQEPMHPADQFDAFFALSSEYGMSAEDIAARFGVTQAVVKQRLKLAAVSPALIHAYRQDEMNLDQLTAFTVTDDHAKQEKVWAAADGQYCDRDDLVAALTEEEISATDPLARFVGKEAYVAAGGIIVRDLFDEDGEGYFADIDRLHELADAKFEAAAADVRAEGWQWVAVMKRFDYAAVAGMRRVYPRVLSLSEEDRARFGSLDAEHDRLLEEEESDARDTELERLEQAMDALRGEEVFAPAERAIAGAIVSLEHDGALRIERGFIRPEDDPGQPKQPRLPKEGPAPLSANLVRELTAQQTMALRDALGGNGEAALVAVTHALAATQFYIGARVSCLALRADSRFLDGLAPCIAESPAGQRITARHEAWAARLPQEPDQLWGFVVRLAADERLALLAHCAGLSVDAVREQEAGSKAGVSELTTTVRLDLRGDWQPTAANYFSRVSRARILEAVREGVSPEAADNLAGLKKAALAAEAERRLSSKGWLPPLLRPPLTEQVMPETALAAE